MMFPAALEIVKNWLREGEPVSDARILALLNGDVQLQRILMDTLLHEGFAVFNDAAGMQATGIDEAPADTVYDVFISYSRKENVAGHVDYIVNEIVKRYKLRHDRTLHISYDREAIRTGEDWKHKIRTAIRHSKVFIAILSPNYLASEVCRFEWERFVEHQQSWHADNEHLHTGIDSIIPPYVIRMPDLMDKDEALLEDWSKDIRRRDLMDLCDWFGEGEAALAQQTSEAHSQKFSALTERCSRKLADAGRYKKIPDNIPPFFKEHLPRTALLTAIHERFKDGPVVGLWGFPGMGKSTLAFSYAREYKLEYAGGCWYFPAEGMRDMPGLVFGSIPQKWGVQFTEEELKDETLRWQRIRTHLEQSYLENPTHRTLLIFDNAENAATVLNDETIRHYLPQGIDLLITCREKVRGMRLGNWETQVSKLTETESLQLLRHYHPFNAPGDYEAATKTCRLLDGYTLGLTIVGVYLANAAAERLRVGYAEVLESMQQSGLGFLDAAGQHTPSLPGGYGSRDARWGQQTSVLLKMLLEQLDERQIRALEYAALMPPDAVALPWMEELVKEEWPDAFPPRAYPGIPGAWENLVASLKRLALLSETDEAEVVRMHRVFGEVVRGRMEGAEEKWERIISISTNEGENSWDTWHELKRKWRITVLTGLATLMLDEHRPDFSLLNAVVPLLDRIGNHTLAKEFAEKAVDLQLVSGAYDSPTLANSYSSLCTVLYSLGKFEAAKDCIEKAIAIDEQHDGTTPLTLSARYTNLGAILQVLGEFDIAKENVERAIVIDEQHFKADHPTLAIDYSNLASILQDLGKYDRALEFAERATAIDEQHYDAVHPILADGYSQLARILQDLGRYEAAKERIEQAIAIAEQHFDAAHLTMSRLYHNLASILHDMGHYKESLVLIEKAIAIDENCFETTHPALASRYHNFAVFLRELGKYELAMKRIQQAIAIKVLNYGASHPDLASSYSVLALILQNLGKYEAAKERIQQAITITELHFDSTHPTLAVRYHNLATILQDLGKYEDAKERMEQAIAIDMMNYKPDHPTFSDDYSCLARIVLDMGNKQHACKLMNDAYDIRLAAFGPQHPDTKDSRQWLDIHCT